jgi:hypothetical protein
MYTKQPNDEFVGWRNDVKGEYEIRPYAIYVIG